MCVSRAVVVPRKNRFGFATGTTCVYAPPAGDEVLQAIGELRQDQVLTLSVIGALAYMMWVGPQVITEDFARPLTPTTFVTGVAYYDSNGLNYAWAGTSPWVYHAWNLAVLVLCAGLLRAHAVRLFLVSGSKVWEPRSFDENAWSLSRRSW